METHSWIQLVSLSSSPSSLSQVFISSKLSPRDIFPVEHGILDASEIGLYDQRSGFRPQDSDEPTGTQEAPSLSTTGSFGSLAKGLQEDAPSWVESAASGIWGCLMKPSVGASDVQRVKNSSLQGTNMVTELRQLLLSRILLRHPRFWTAGGHIPSQCTDDLCKYV